MFTTAFKPGILVEFHESQTHRMDERTDHTQSEVNRMTDKQDQEHGYEFYDNWQSIRELKCQSIEHSSQDTSRQTNRKQSDI